MEEQQSSKWQSFVSLSWYDQTIEFIFRFVAKTSEPLLAAGLVISAADVLTKGQLMTNNAALSYGWAWAQSIAIESSGGVVLVYGLQSFQQHDKVKGWLYIVLATLLAIVGGMMLYSQLLSSATGANDAFSDGGWLTQILIVLRVIVSVTYVVLCRTKHIMFHTLLKEPPAAPELQVEVQSAPQATVSAEDMQRVLAQLEELASLKAILSQVQVNEIAQPDQSLVQIEGPKAPDPLLEPIQGVQQQSLASVANEPEEPIQALPNRQSYGDQIEALYKDNPQITAVEIEKQLGCSRTTAANWLKRVRPAQ